WDLSDTEGSSRVSDERIAIAESRGLTAELNSAYFSKAWGQMLERNYRQASDGAQRSLEIALASGDERRVVEARMLLGCVETVVGDPATGIPAMQEALNAATDLGWKDFLPFGYTNVGSGAGEARWYRVAEEALEK